MQEHKGEMVQAHRSYKVKCKVGQYKLRRLMKK